MNRTNWQVSPSFRYDTLCLLNTLTGDPFYLEFNEETYNYFKPLITDEAAVSLANLKRIIKDDGKSIISALLCYCYSAVDGESLAEMQQALENPTVMESNFRAGTSDSDEDWGLFLKARDDLRIIFRFLEAIDFPTYWQTVILPELEGHIHQIAAYLSDYDVVAQLETLIGRTLPSSSIQVYVLNYTRPHGIKVLGQSFITSASWNPQIALRTAIHEMMHPPYNLAGDKPLQAAIETLQQDPFIAERFSGHNPDFGYNSFTGYVEENCVRALEQLVNESFNIARNPQERWREEDDGMHVLAAALYYCLKTQHFTGNFRDFFLQLLQTDLAPGKVRAVYSAFYASPL